MKITEKTKMMIISDLHKYLPMCNNQKSLKLLAILLMTIGFLSSCNYKGRDFFEPPTGLSSPNGNLTLDAPVLLNPSNGATGLDYMQTFEWNLVESATFYEMQLAEDGQSFMQGMQFETISNMFEYDDLKLQTDYSWRVRAGFEDIRSDWSDTWMFETKAEDVTPPDLSLQKACIEHGVGVSYIKLLWEMNYIDTATAINMIIQLKFTGPGTDTTLEATPNQNLLFTHILQISSYGLYNYQISQILLNGEPIEFTGDSQGEVDVDSDELNAGECDI